MEENFFSPKEKLVENEQSKDTTSEEILDSVEKIQDFKEQYDQMKDKWLRSCADFENLQRRSQKEKDEISKYSSMKFAREILAVGDNLERAISNLKELEPTNTLEQVIKGLEATYHEFIKTISKNGITKIQSLDKMFDPHLHQAVLEVESNEVDPGTIVSVMQEGYLMHDKLLRPAMVSISKC